MTKVLNAIENLYVQTAAGAKITLPADFPAFEGHFPGAPVLPGIVQIQMAVYSIGRAEGRAVQLAEIKKAKFAAPAAPGDTLFFTINKKEDYYNIIIKNAEEKLLSQFQLGVTNA